MSDYRWPREYRCYTCSRLGIGRRATIRAFTGAAGEFSGGGWPACDEHAAHELERAFKALLGGGRNWVMTVYRVEPDVYNFPRLTRVIFTATAKPTALQGLPHARTTDP